MVSNDIKMFSTSFKFKTSLNLLEKYLDLKTKISECKLFQVVFKLYHKSIFHFLFVLVRKFISYQRHCFVLILSNLEYIFSVSLQVSFLICTLQ